MKTMLGLGDVKAYILIRNRIKSVEENIHSHYLEHKTIDNMHIEGIGLGTKKDLALILRKGVKEAREIFSKERKQKNSHHSLSSN